MSPVGVRSAVVWAVACSLVLPVHTAAQPVPPPPPESAGATEHRPWAAGVSETEQAIALEHFVAGNREFTEARFAQALGRYREALHHWDHPAIRYNIAVCLINLDQPVEARSDLERGLAFGAAPLGGDAYAQGLTYRKLLDGQLAHLALTCREPGAEVTLDGRRVLAGPGASEEFLLPGAHQVVATKPGYLTASRTLDLVAGKRTAFEIEPSVAVAATPRVVRRWAAWKPLAVLGSGGALLGLGALAYLAARHNFTVYDRDVAKHCSAGCTASDLAALPDARRAYDRAGTEQTLAVVLLSTGAAAVIAGAIGVVLNQPRLQLDAARPGTPVVITAAPVPGGATAVLRGAF